MRQVCKDCRVEYQPTDEELREVALSRAELQQRYGTTRLYKAVGCAACNRNGYRGRTGIYELLTVDDELRHLIHDRASEQALRAHVLERGMKSLRDDAMRWASAGVISLEEAIRVTRE